mgnify:FL=1
MAAEEKKKAELALEKELLEGLAEMGDAFYTRDPEPEPDAPQGCEAPGAVGSSFVSWAEPE